jgi:hypothetical protein
MRHDAMQEARRRFCIHGLLQYRPIIVQAIIAAIDIGFLILFAGMRCVRLTIVRAFRSYP